MALARLFEQCGHFAEAFLFVVRNAIFGTNPKGLGWRESVGQRFTYRGIGRVLIHVATLSGSRTPGKGDDVIQASSESQ